MTFGKEIKYVLCLELYYYAGYLESILNKC